MLHTTESKKVGMKKGLKLNINPVGLPKESDLATSDHSSERKSAFDLIQEDSGDGKKNEGKLKLVIKEEEEKTTQKSTPEKHFFDFGLTFNPQNPKKPDSFFHNYHQYDKFCDTSIRKCNRVSQEDRFTQKIYLRDNKEEIFVGVFDGHRNSEVSFLLSEVLGYYIINHPEYSKNTKKAIIEAHTNLDGEILKYLRESEIEGGSTSLTVLIRKDMLYVCNLGDSVGFTCGTEGIQQITREHKPSNPEERARLESKGAFISETKANVFRLLGGITISRSFGDPGYKEFMISEPDVIAIPLEQLEKIEYLIIGTDGVWEFLKMPELSDAINEWKSDNGSNIKFFSEFLVDKAIDRGRDRKKDNMTLMVIDIEAIRKEFMN